MAKERGEKLSGVLVVRLRARNRGSGLCSELATATARWRPLGSAGARGKGRELQLAAKKRWMRLGATRGCQREAGGGRAGPPRKVGAEQRRRQEKQPSKLEEGEKGPKRNFQKFQGPNCKPVITFKIGLK